MSIQSKRVHVDTHLFIFLEHKKEKLSMVLMGNQSKKFVFNFCIRRIFTLKLIQFFVGDGNADYSEHAH